MPKPTVKKNNSDGWLVVGGFYGISTFVGYLMLKYSCNVKTVLFRAIQFSISTQFSFIWHIDRTLPGATNPVQSEVGSDGNEEVLRIPQFWTLNIILFCVISRTLVMRGLTPFQRCSRCILQPHLTGQNSSDTINPYRCGGIIGSYLFQRY